MDDIVNCLAAEFGKYNKIERAVLFGSRARGDCGERSDYDIAVFGDVSSADKVRIRAWAGEELPTLHKIDLTFAADVADKKFLQSIEQEGICFYVKAGK